MCFIAGLFFVIQYSTGISQKNKSLIKNNDNVINKNIPIPSATFLEVVHQIFFSLLFIFFCEVEGIILIPQKYLPLFHKEEH
ncbi:Uncharacterised protein [Chlamydia abortus]|nr:Uncharacterised protein [Chlamydia abortus]